MLIDYADIYSSIQRGFYCIENQQFIQSKKASRNSRECESITLSGPFFHWCLFMVWMQLLRLHYWNKKEVFYAHVFYLQVAPWKTCHCWLPNCLHWRIRFMFWSLWHCWTQSGWLPSSYMARQGLLQPQVYFKWKENVFVDYPFLFFYWKWK